MSWLGWRIQRLLEPYSHFLIVYGIAAALVGYAVWPTNWPLAAVLVLMILRYGWRHRDDENPTEEDAMWDDDEPDDDEPGHLWARPRP